MLALVEVAFILGILLPAAGLILFASMGLYWLIQRYRARGEASVELELSRQIDALVLARSSVSGLVARLVNAQYQSLTGTPGAPSRTDRSCVVTVLYADVDGFGSLPNSADPERQMDILDRFFYDLDGVVALHGVVRIRRMGDAFLCAGGVPEVDHTSPFAVVLAALGLMAHMELLNGQRGADGHSWRLRVGIDTGIVQLSGYSEGEMVRYDIQGATVRMASRMESSGGPGVVNISNTTYDSVKEFFDCAPRGAIPVKNKGEVAMYAVERIKPEYAADPLGHIPNRRFLLHLQQLRLNDLESIVTTLLERMLSPELYFHSLKRTLDVFAQVEIIAREEGLSDEEILILRTAALFHDTGFITAYEGHEEMGVKILREVLPKYRYSPDQVDRIAALVYATRPSAIPSNRLEEILRDADSDYLGRMDYFVEAENLYRELSARGLVGSREQWREWQIAQLRDHRYYTQTSQRLRESTKQAHLQRLLELSAGEDPLGAEGRSGDRDGTH